MQPDISGVTPKASTEISVSSVEVAGAGASEAEVGGAAEVAGAAAEEGGAERRDVWFYYGMNLERRVIKAVPEHGYKDEVVGQPKQAVVGLSRPMMSSRGRVRGVTKAASSAGSTQVADPNKGAAKLLANALRSIILENQSTNFRVAPSASAAVPANPTIISNVGPADSKVHGAEKKKEEKPLFYRRLSERGLMKAGSFGSTLPKRLAVTDSNRQATKEKKNALRSVIQEVEFVNFGVLPQGHREPQLTAPTATAITTSTAPTVAAETVPTPAVRAPTVPAAPMPRSVTGGSSQPAALGRGRARGFTTPLGQTVTAAPMPRGVTGGSSKPAALGRGRARGFTTPLETTGTAPPMPRDVTGGSSKPAALGRGRAKGLSILKK